MQQVRCKPRYHRRVHVHHGRALKEIDFPTKYYSSKLSVMTKADNDFNYIKPENFHGKTIGAQSPAPQAEEAEATFGKHNATVKFYPSQNDTNMGLTNGRLDGIIADKFYLATWMTSGEGKDYAAMDAIVANGIYFVMW